MGAHPRLQAEIAVTEILSRRQPVMIKTNLQTSVLASMSQGGRPTCLSTSTTAGSQGGWFSSFASNMDSSSSSSNSSSLNSSSFFSSFSSNNGNSEKMGRDCKVWMPQMP